MTMTKPDVIDQAVSILARRRLTQRPPGLPPVICPDRWLARTEHELCLIHADTLARIDPCLYTAESLADLLDGRPPRTQFSNSRSRRACDGCGGTGWVFVRRVAGVEYVDRCPACSEA